MSEAPRVRIHGGGPVGLALALFLLREGFPPADIAVELPAADPPEWLATRPLALGHGSWQLLSRIVRLPEAAPIRRIEVSLEGRAGRTHLDAAEAGVPALGRVTRHRELVAALREAAAVRPFAPPGADTACSVVVHADGDTGDDVQRRDFDQVAILAELQTPLADNDTAFERFTAEGPLAMLPLPSAGRYALVWCGAPDEAARRLALTDATFVEELSARLGERFGLLSLVTARSRAALSRRARERTTSGREVWIGNAAQALHPVAGQGLNLGLRDAFVLARCLGDARARPADPQSVLAALSDYRRRRLTDRQALLGITDALASLFTIGRLRPLESVALAALDLAPPMREAFAARLMYGFR